jgi:uncharacterized protein YybS (DUF2232 family)
MKNVNQLTKGAMFLAIYSVLLLITLYIPLLGAIVNFFLPLPFILFAAQNNFKSSVVFFVASLFLSLILGTMLAIPMTMMFGMTGLAMGYLINIKKGRWAVYFASSMVFLINIIGMYIISVVFFKINFIKDSMEMFQESYRTSVEMMEKLGQAPNKEVIQQFETGFAMIETLMPSIFVMAAFLLVFIIMSVSMPILKRFGVQLSGWTPLRELTLPKSLLWYYLISMVASMFLHPEQGSYVYIAVSNLVYILQFFMIVQGISYVFYYCHVKGFAKAIPIVVVVFSILLPFLLYIVRIFGIIDLGFDLRKRLEKKQ